MICMFVMKQHTFKQVISSMAIAGLCIPDHEIIEFVHMP